MTDSNTKVQFKSVLTKYMTSCRFLCYKNHDLSTKNCGIMWFRMLRVKTIFCSTFNSLWQLTELNFLSQINLWKTHYPFIHTVAVNYLPLERNPQFSLFFHVFFTRQSYLPLRIFHQWKYRKILTAELILLRWEIELFELF